MDGGLDCILVGEFEERDAEDGGHGWDWVGGKRREVGGVGFFVCEKGRCLFAGKLRMSIVSD